MAPETENVGWERSLVFPKGTARWVPWILYHSSFETIFSFTIFWIGVGGSLCCVDARDDTAGGGSGASAKEMGNQACSNRHVCQISFHLVLLFFGFKFLSSQLNSLLSDGGETEVLLPQGVDVCNDSCISQVEERVIYKGAVLRSKALKGATCTGCLRLYLD